ncbi:unnamed protein product, partial [Meganyctiphanes norvegica]
MGTCCGVVKDKLKKMDVAATPTGEEGLERQIHMQNEMREKMMSMQIARSRELLYWLGSFYVIASIGMIAGYRRTKKPGVLFPLLPLTFITAYQADLAYGSKLNRINMEAENILLFEKDLVNMPLGLPSPSSIDEARERQEESQRLNKALYQHRSFGYY